MLSIKLGSGLFKFEQNWMDRESSKKSAFQLMLFVSKKFGIFSVCAPQLSGRILFAPPPPDSRATFLRNDLLCNGGAL